MSMDPEDFVVLGLISILGIGWLTLMINLTNAMLKAP